MSILISYQIAMEFSVSVKTSLKKSPQYSDKNDSGLSKMLNIIFYYIYMYLGAFNDLTSIFHVHISYSSRVKTRVGTQGNSATYAIIRQLLNPCKSSVLVIHVQIWRQRHAISHIKKDTPTSTLSITLRYHRVKSRLPLGVLF